MRLEKPTRSWLIRWQKNHVQFGGWGGPATIAALTCRAIKYYQNGASAKIAGMATAQEYKLFSSQEQWKELAETCPRYRDLKYSTCSRKFPDDYCKEAWYA